MLGSAASKLAFRIGLTGLSLVNDVASALRSAPVEGRIRSALEVLARAGIRAEIRQGRLELLDGVEPDVAALLHSLFGLALEREGAVESAADDATLLEAVIESVGHGVLLYVGDLPVHVNAAARRLLALGDDEMPDASTFKPRHLDGRPLEPDESPAKRAHETGQPQPYRLRSTLPDGSERIFDGTVSPILLSGGEDMGVVVVFRDVTEECGRQLHTEQMLDKVFEELPAAAVVIDWPSTVIRSTNRAFLELVGLDRDEIVGERMPYPWWADGQEYPDPNEQPDRLEWLFRRRDGSVVPVEFSRILIHGPGGGPDTVVHLVTDLSERRRFEQQLVQSGKLAAIGELAAGVAHEINNPLFAILGLVEFLLKEVEPGSKAHSRLTLVHDTGLEMKEIVRALLDFAREPSDERQLMHVADTVAQTIELVRRTSSAKDVDIVERLDPKPAHVHGNPNQLKQILLNLLTNAYQAMPGGGTVTVELERRDGWAVVTVSDTGPGIPEELHTQIFEPFFTTKRGGGGTGLGLAVSHGIAAAHGGCLEVRSTPGEGATFTLRLPLATEDRA